ncbi:MAG TPA: CRISPR-associated endonuclease Cas2 [Candidatus Sulfotelmatobacter sp.]|jgi:CRISPR-associated endonuclease Cas2|nr:CRISPR-associated endonuclease Cas2 [Candidatus Sulfotelmatobacter sp.]
MSYLICYDLDKPGQDYSDLISALKKLGAYRFQYSSWFLEKTQYTPLQIVNHLAQFVDGNDRLLVVEVQNNAAWRNLMITDNTVRQILAA